MNLTTTMPRSRPAHLATIPAPSDCASEFLQLKAPCGDILVAERDPTLPFYQVKIPALEKGQEAILEGREMSETEVKPAAGISISKYEDQVGVSLAGLPFLTFHHGSNYPKPVINPILTPKGRNMLREPIPAWTPGEHPWQRGLTLMQGSVNGIDCWNERNREEFGYTVQNDITVSQGPLSLLIATDNTWYVQNKPLMTDSRSYRLFDTPRDAAILDIALTLKASHGPLTLGNTKEGGFLCLRVNPTMNAKEGGQMRNSYGASDEGGCWSKAAHWMDYYGPVGDETVGFAIFDHPDNFRYPTTWHTRGYGLFAPNCWMFKPDHHLDAGESMTFRWRVTIHTGNTEEADIENRFLDYVDGIRAHWV